MFTIVEFEDGLQVVPSSWIKKENSVCMWPNIINQIKVTKLISGRANTDSSWKELPVSRVFGKADNYVKGVAKLKVYQDLSDIDSDTCSKIQRREMKRKNFESEEEEDYSPSLLSFPDVPERLRANSCSLTFTDSAIINTSVKTGLEPIESTAATHERNIAPAANSNVKDSANCCSCKEQIEANSKLLQEIVKKSNFIIQKLLQMDKAIEATVINPHDGPSEVGSIMKQFPIRSLENLEKFEIFLQEEDNYKNLVKALKGIGGNSVYFVGTKILKRVLTNEIAEMFSLIGAKKKRSFKGLLLFRAMLETSRSCFPNVTEDEVGVLVANWLRHAKQRKEREQGAVSNSTVNAQTN